MNRTFRASGAAPQVMEPWEGILVVDKPGGMTSHDVVYKIRKHFGIKKVGHAGTLDPMATGVLVILLGRGTKLSDMIMGSDKTYTGVMCLGARTSTQDAEGEFLNETDPSGVTQEALEGEMQKLTGDLMQVPPMVSAIKQNGVPLYKLARQGKVVERKPRLVHIYEFSLKQFDPPYAHFRLRCTKGTYVRTACADVGDALGCGAYLDVLRRTRSGRLRAKDSVPLAEVLEMSRAQLAEHVIPVNQVRADDF